MSEGLDDENMFEEIWVGKIKLILNHMRDGENSVDVCIGETDYTLCSIHENGTIELSPTKRFTVKSERNFYAPREEEF